VGEVLGDAAASAAPTANAFLHAVRTDQ